MDKISREQVSKAVAALLAHLNKERKDKKVEKANILEEGQAEGAEAAVYVSIALKKVPENISHKPVKIPLAYPLASEHRQVALFTKDPQREYKDLIASKGIKSINKVIGITKLRNKYKPFEAKRLLCSSYDIFLADDRILPLLPKLLGKEFFKKKKLPIAVNLTKKKMLEREFSDALNSAYLAIASGPCQTVKIALASQTADQIVDNVLVSLPAIVSCFPKKWKNVQSVHLKTGKSMALPIYSEILEL